MTWKRRSERHPPGSSCAPQTLDEVAPTPTPDNLDPFERLMAMGGHARGRGSRDDRAAAWPVRQRPGVPDRGAQPRSEAAGDLSRTEEQDNGLLALNPPRDLVRRMTALPDLLPEGTRGHQAAVESPKTSTTPARGSKLAQDAQKMSWPDCLYLAPLHPVLDWAADRVLAAFARDEAPVLAVNVGEPVFCVQATWSNRSRPGGPRALGSGYRPARPARCRRT